MTYKINSALKNIRKQKGVSINELFEKTGVSRSFLTNLDNNGYIPTFDKLGKIANVLNVPLESLLQISVVSDSLEFKPLGMVYHRNDAKKAKLTALIELDQDKLRFAGIVTFNFLKNNDSEIIINTELPNNSDVINKIDNSKLLNKISQTSFYNQEDFFTAFYKLHLEDQQKIALDFMQGLNGFLIERELVKTIDSTTGQGLDYTYKLSWFKTWYFILASDNHNKNIADLLGAGGFLKNTPLKIKLQNQLATSDYFE